MSVGWEELVQLYELILSEIPAPVRNVVFWIVVGGLPFVVAFGFWSELEVWIDCIYDSLVRISLFPGY